MNWMSLHLAVGHRDEYPGVIQLLGDHEVVAHGVVRHVDDDDEAVGVPGDAEDLEPVVPPLR